MLLQDYKQQLPFFLQSSSWWSCAFPHSNTWSNCALKVTTLNYNVTYYKMIKTHVEFFRHMNRQAAIFFSSMLQTHELRMRSLIVPACIHDCCGQPCSSGGDDGVIGYPTIPHVALLPFLLRVNFTLPGVMKETIRPDLRKTTEAWNKYSNQKQKHLLIHALVHRTEGGETPQTICQFITEIDAVYQNTWSSVSGNLNQKREIRHSEMRPSLPLPSHPIRKCSWRSDSYLWLSHSSVTNRYV